MTPSPKQPRDLSVIDKWWRAANYVSVGQIYLLDNARLERSLTVDDTKPRLLGHFGTVPALNLVWAHLNRLIIERELSVVYIAGPGHGGPGVVANAWLDGTYSELFSDVTLDGPVVWCGGAARADPSATCSEVTSVSGLRNTYIALRVGGTWKADIDVDASSSLSGNPGVPKTPAAPSASPT